MRTLSVCNAGPTFWRAREAGEERCFTYHYPASWRGDPTDFGYPTSRVRTPAPSAIPRILTDVRVCSRPVGGTVLAAHCIECARTTRSLPVKRRLGRREPLEFQAGELRSFRGSPGEYSQDWRKSFKKFATQFYFLSLGLFFSKYWFIIYALFLDRLYPSLSASRGDGGPRWRRVRTRTLSGRQRQRDVTRATVLLGQRNRRG